MPIYEGGLEKLTGTVHGIYSAMVVEVCILINKMRVVGMIRG
jgi:hypothetical protein